MNKPTCVLLLSTVDAFFSKIVLSLLYMPEEGACELLLSTVDAFLFKDCSKTTI